LAAGRHPGPRISRRLLGPGRRGRVPAAHGGRSGGPTMMDGSSRVLLADIGGTNARFALADPGADAPLLVDSVQRFAVADFPSLAEAARHYLHETGQHEAGIVHGVFAVAGRVDGDEARITNHPWVISRPRTKAQLGFEQVTLVNDFAAQAMAIPLLRAG